MGASFDIGRSIRAQDAENLCSWVGARGVLHF